MAVASKFDTYTEMEAQPQDIVIDSKELEAAAAEPVQDMETDGKSDASLLNFAPLNAQEASGGKSEFRRVLVPPHRYTPLRQSWMSIYTPIVEHMQLQIRLNPKRRAVELKTSKHTTDPGAIQKAADFVKAFMLGFEIKDAIALLRLDDLYLDSFEIKDVKMLQGEHLSRAIGRIAGQDGKTKFAIENATKTRIVLAETKVHLLGSFQNTKIAKDAISRLIMGAPPGKVYARMRSVATRQKERF